jgi:hypothetical protein
MASMWDIQVGDSDASVAFGLTKMILLAARDEKRDWTEAEILAVFERCLLKVRPFQAKEGKAKS